MLKSGALAPSILESGGDWFLHSGIQEPSGGVARYYRSDLARNAGISTEITGYSVSFLIYAYQRTSKPEYLAAALRSARFLTREAWRPDLQLFPFEPGSNAAYFFDSGIITRGLLAAWRATEETEFLDIAIATGRGMLEHFRASDELAPILSLPSRQPLPYASRWSAAPGCYQLKSAMAWHDLFEITGDSAFCKGYEAALARALRDHESFLPGDALPERVMDRLHAYLYFLEGLLPCAERPECRAAMQIGIDRVAGYVREIAPRFARSDVYAQLLRVRLFADSAVTAEESFAAAAFQFDSGDERFLGGFGFGTQAGTMMPYVNPVSTAFCAQALDLWRQGEAGSLALDRHSLI
jgi:hypothetical protein